MKVRYFHDAKVLELLAHVCQSDGVTRGRSSWSFFVHASHNGRLSRARSIQDFFSHALRLQSVRATRAALISMYFRVVLVGLMESVLN